LGTIRSHWQRKGDKAEVELTLPPGMEAHVTLPGVEPCRMTGSQKWSVVPAP